MAKDQFTRRSGDDYAEAYSNLLPTGLAWPRENDALLMKVVRGLAQVWGNWADRRAADWIEIETDPRRTIEMLPDWERNWGLPDPCFLGMGQGVDARRAFLMLKMTLQGGQSRAWFIWVAAQLGYTVRITEYAPFMVGVTPVGDTRPLDNIDENALVGPFGVFA